MKKKKIIIQGISIVLLVLSIAINWLVPMVTTLANAGILFSGISSDFLNPNDFISVGLQSIINIIGIIIVLPLFIHATATERYFSVYVITTYAATTIYSLTLCYLFYDGGIIHFASIVIFFLAIIMYFLWAIDMLHKVAVWLWMTKVMYPIRSVHYIITELIPMIRQAKGI
jgi:hypothetical protein